MTELEQFVAELEAKEAAEDMHFSTYYIPQYYQEDVVDGLNQEETNGN